MSITYYPARQTHRNRQLKKKITEKWKRKIANRSGILGCTLGAGAEMDMEYFHDTGLPSKKVFMLLDASKILATKIMRLKHNLRAGVGKMIIVPNLHS